MQGQEAVLHRKTKPELPIKMVCKYICLLFNYQAHTFRKCVDDTDSLYSHHFAKLAADFFFLFAESMSAILKWFRSMVAAKSRVEAVGGR